jgi:hypothetical protein
MDASLVMAAPYNAVLLAFADALSQASDIVKMKRFRHFRYSVCGPQRFIRSDAQRVGRTAQNPDQSETEIDGVSAGFVCGAGRIADQRRSRAIAHG